MTLPEQSPTLESMFNPWVSDLERVLQWRSLSSPQQESLQHRLLHFTQSHQDAIAFCPPDSTAIAQVIPRWLHLFREGIPQLQNHPALAPLFHPPQRGQTLITAWRLWIPWAMHLTHLKHSPYGDRPLIQGVLGVQGAGKTTLGQVMEILLAILGRSLLNLSIDDFYLTYDERQALRQRDPRLLWRGPPGTHDVSLAIQTLDDLRRGVAMVPIPRFEKSLHGGQGDRTPSEGVGPVDVVWFEGWLVGCEPVADSRFDHPLPAPIVSAGDRQFARDCNQRLRSYQPLWQRLDQWAVLVPGDYRWSKRWRQEAERLRIAAGGAGLSDKAVSEFVDYFWRALHPDLFVMPWLDLTSTPTERSPHCLVEIQSDRRIGRLWTRT